MPDRSLSVLKAGMGSIGPRHPAEILETSPILARLGLAPRDVTLRARAGEKIALIMIDRLAEPDPPVVDAGQMALPIV